MFQRSSLGSPLKHPILEHGLAIQLLSSSISVRIVTASIAASIPILSRVYNINHTWLSKKHFHLYLNDRTCAVETYNFHTSELGMSCFYQKFNPHFLQKKRVKSRCPSPTSSSANARLALCPVAPHRALHPGYGTKQHVILPDFLICKPLLHWPGHPQNASHYKSVLQPKSQQARLAPLQHLLRRQNWIQTL